MIWSQKIDIRWKKSVFMAQQIHMNQPNLTLWVKWLGFQAILYSKSFFIDKNSQVRIINNWNIYTYTSLVWMQQPVLVPERCDELPKQPWW